MVAKEIAVKKYVVKLSAEERERLNTLIQSGKHPARKLTRARVLLKAHAGEAGEGWSDRPLWRRDLACTANSYRSSAFRHRALGPTLLFSWRTLSTARHEIVSFAVGTTDA